MAWHGAGPARRRRTSPRGARPSILAVRRVTLQGRAIRAFVNAVTISLLPLVCVLPWALLLAFLLFRVRLPRELPAGPPRRFPLVTVVVPARNEAENLPTLLSTVTASRYPDFEVVVVDDQSSDGTGDLARSFPEGTARRITVLDGAELPDGWLGKPWACWQGAHRAEGELLVFTDADTVHGPELLERAVAAMEEDDADMVTVAGRQLMESFWERVLQPQVFFTMVLRFHDVERAAGSGRWRDVIANGQFLMFRRAAYEALGGHESVRDEVVEDLALAQRAVREGRRMSPRLGETVFATRMYRSLGALVQGWSKNILIGGLQTVKPGLRPFVAPTSVVAATTLWLLPPVVLALALALGGGGGWLVWSGGAVGSSALLWTLFTRRMGAPWYYGLLYPLGASVGLFIFLRAWKRGSNVEWKGRIYRGRDVARGDPGSR